MVEVANPLHVLGCDVGKDNVVIFDSVTGVIAEVCNTQKALARAIADCGMEAHSLIVCEATGGFEAALLAAAAAAGIPAHRADPRKAAAFIRSLRSHGKTDAIDAEALARYGLERGDRLPRWQLPTKAQSDLAQLVRLRADLVQTHGDYTRRAKAPGKGRDKAHLKATLKALAKRIEAIEADIETVVQGDEKLSQTVDTIQEIPGCGPKTALVLTALLPEIGQLNRQQVAALAGVAPHPRQSGKADGYRRISGGRPAIKRGLFMAAMAARQHHPQLRAFFERLRAAGKPKLVAIMAVARKLVTIANAKVRDHSTRRCCGEG